MKPINGVKNCHITNTNRSIKKKPCLSKRERKREYCSGNTENSILDPSRGGIGTRLKIASTTFITTIRNDISINASGKESASLNLIMIPKKKAIVKLDNGPAAATNSSPHLLFP